MRVRWAALRAGEWPFLPHLLVPALQRAIALAQMDGMALAVAEDLKLDMARLLEIFLKVDGIVAEGGPRLGTGGRESVREVGRRLRNLHAAAAAAGGCLDQHRIADFRSDAGRVDVVVDAALGARHAGNAEATCAVRFRLDLVAHDADVIRLGTDEGDAMLVENVGESRVLGQEAIARMNRFGAGDLAGGDQGRNVEIAFARLRRTDADALVGELDMHGVGIGGRVHGDSRDAELLARPQDTQGDLAAIRDQDLVEHQSTR